ncbi:ATP citrate synthase [Candidatus Gracilibacteria bacterium]|nr:ATP citrate synthase [Candidatus Gracilibacteria bacterium]
MFTKKSFACLYGLQLGAAQHMLDFDFLSEREVSVLCFIHPGKKYALQKLFYGDKEVLVPSFPDFASIPQNMREKLDTLVNFASFRSAQKSTLEAMGTGYFQNIVIIAEGIPERQTLELMEKNRALGLNIIGPATVGAMRAGIFRAGNTGGSLENIIDSRLYQSGSVGFVSKSGGMSNELRRVIADRTDGTSLSLALGGDAYNIMDFPSAIKILEDDSETQMIVMLGEIGGRDELEVAQMITEKEITKPIIAWCIGTINEQIKGEVQFGHAGAKSNKQEETASYKNQALREAGAIVPESYMDFGEKIEKVFLSLHPNFNPFAHKEKRITISEKMRLIKSRKKTSFTSTISDERGEELLYNGKKISEFTKTPDIAEIIGQLWLKKSLPDYAKKFLNTVLILIADHGPAVSGAQNTIITARAGNDLKSSLIAGLTTIGPRFGGAIDGAAKNWLECLAKNISPNDFVKKMKDAGENIPGIGHKVKSKFNPDTRCTILLDLAKYFPEKKYLHFALEVEQLTLEKKSNLILNVDGYIAAMLLDIFEDIGMDYNEKKMYIEAGIFNGLFLLARSIGFIGHAIDQKRLGEGLYRADWSDIHYTD